MACASESTLCATMVGTAPPSCQQSAVREAGSDLAQGLLKRRTMTRINGRPLVAGREGLPACTDLSSSSVPPR